MTDLEDALLQLVQAEWVWGLDIDVLEAAEDQIRSGNIDVVLSTLLCSGAGALRENGVLSWLEDFPEVLRGVLQEDDDVADSVYWSWPRSKILEEVPLELVAERLRREIFRTVHSDWPINLLRSLSEIERWELIIELCAICAANVDGESDYVDFSWIYYALDKPSWWMSWPEDSVYEPAKYHADVIRTIVDSHLADGRDPRGWFNYLWSQLPGCKVSQEWCCRFRGLANELEGVFGLLERRLAHQDEPESRFRRVKRVFQRWSKRSSSTLALRS